MVIVPCGISYRRRIVVQWKDEVDEYDDELNEDDSSTEEVALRWRVVRGECSFAHTNGCCPSESSFRLAKRASTVPNGDIAVP